MRCNVWRISTTYTMQAAKQKFLAFRVYRFRDRAAYSELYDAYFVVVRKFMSAKLPRSEDADELSNEVFLRAWEYMTANAVENARALFFKIAHNLIADFYRKGAHDQPIDQYLERTLEAPGSLSEDVARKHEAEEVRAKLRTLREEYRDVLVMRFLEEMTVDEIALALGKSANNVRVLLFRAKRALKKL